MGRLNAADLLHDLIRGGVDYVNAIPTAVRDIDSDRIRSQRRCCECKQKWQYRRNQILYSHRVILLICRVNAAELSPNIKTPGSKTDLRYPGLVHCVSKPPYSQAKKMSTSRDKSIVRRTESARPFSFAIPEREGPLLDKSRIACRGFDRWGEW